MSQKIPLFGGVPYVIPAGSPNPTIESLFTPPDVGLPVGLQSYYEVNLWWTQGPDTDSSTGIMDLSAYVTGDLATVKYIYRTEQQFPSRPIQALRNYMMRGGVTLRAAIETPALPEAFFGYYRRVGGVDEAREHRFIGGTTPVFTAGVPLEILPGEKKIFHEFEAGRIDVLSLATMTLPATAQTILITFENEAGGVLASWAQQVVSADPSDGVPGLLDPYSFRDVPFGGGADSTLDHISIESLVGNTQPVQVYGDFWR